MAIISFKNLGNIEQGQIELNKMTIIAGANNTGKTYATYAMYSLLDKDFIFNLSELNPIINELYEEGTYELDLLSFFNENYLKMKKEIEKSFSASLSNVFSTADNEFENSEVSFEINESLIKEEFLKNSYHSTVNIGKKDKIVFEIRKEKNEYTLKLVLLDNSIPKDIITQNLKSSLSKLIFSQLFSQTFLLPAERTGLNLFYRELSSERTAIFHHFGKQEIDKMELIKDLIISKYPQPIADYIDFLNRTHNLKKAISEYKDLAQEIQKVILKGKYRVDEDGIYFLPYKKNSNQNTYNEKISLHLASSTVKTFFSLVFYLEHLAKEGETLIIDEPELNLHPDNQRNIAKILAMIVNRGIKVIVSTHSDYFIKEINNLLMLNDDFKSKNSLMKKFLYQENMILNPNEVNAYLFHSNTIEKMELDLKEGIIATTFDDIICSLNHINDKIYYTKEDEMQENIDD